MTRNMLSIIKRLTGISNFHWIDLTLPQGNRACRYKFLVKDVIILRHTLFCNINIVINDSDF